MRKKARLSATIFVLGYALPVLGNAADTYTCSTQPGPTSTTQGTLEHINNNGVEVGNFGDIGYTYTPGVGWAPLPLAPLLNTPADSYLGAPPYPSQTPYVYAVGINDAGTVVGALGVYPWPSPPLAGTVWGFEQGFSWDPINGYVIANPWFSSADPAVFVANPGFGSYYITEFEGIGKNGLIGGEAYDPNVSTDTAGIGFIYNPTQSPVQGFNPGYTTIQPILSDGSKPLAGSGFSVIWDFNTKGWFVGGGLSASQPREAIVYDPTGHHEFYLASSNAIIMARAINDGDTAGGATNCPNGATSTCYRITGWTAAYDSSTMQTYDIPIRYVGYFADFDSSTGEFEQPQTVNCDQQTGAQQISGIVAWRFTGVDNQNVLTGDWRDASGQNHPLVAYPDLGIPVAVTPEGGFQFNVIVSSPVTTYFIDPPITVGYDYAIGKENPSFASVSLPILSKGSNEYTLLTHGQAFTVAAGQNFDFTKRGFERGVESFQVLGIDPANALNPSNTTAFVSGVTFTATGKFTGTMTPLTAAAEVSDLARAAAEDGDRLEDVIRSVVKAVNSGNTAATCSALGEFVSEVFAYSFRLGPSGTKDLTDRALAIENAFGCR